MMKNFSKAALAGLFSFFFLAVPLTPEFSYAADSGEDEQLLKMESLTNYEEMSDLLEDADQQSPHVTVETIGESVKGRELSLVTLSEDGHIDSDNPTVLFLTQQHGNESLVTESALDIIEQFSAGSKHKTKLLEDVNILIVPRLNLDGAEGDVDWDASNLYRGGLQTRNNADGINLNRTHNSLSQPETRALHENVLQEYDIDYAIDFHHQIANRATEDGEIVTSALLYPTNDNISEEVLDNSKKIGAVVYDSIEPKDYSNIARYHSESTLTSMARNNLAVNYDIPTLLFENRGLSDSPNKLGILEHQYSDDLIDQAEAAMMGTIKALADNSIETADTSMWDTLPEQHTVEE
ncbi:M14 family zinc carboxypeptidase [Alteribacillus sp. HJP-4]|uniref:M14 family zinc carboxypeptidase n=1 Tax=Alteribacillus sp. HJP-4 TaxID=2775394 RepID=UPI0035CD2C7B